METELVATTIVGLSGEAVARLLVPPGHTVGEIRKELARRLGFPVAALKLLESETVQLGAELTDEHTHQQQCAEWMLTCIFMSAPSDRYNILTAAKEDHHGHLRAILQGAELTQRREMLRESGALRYAALHNSLATAKVLIGAARDAAVLEESLVQVDGFGASPLHCAAEQGAEMVELLLSTAAELGCRGRVLMAQTKKGASVLHFAVRNDQLAAANLIITAATAESLLGQLLRKVWCGGATVVHWAARFGYDAMLRLLLNAAAAPPGTLLGEFLAIAAKEATSDDVLQVVRDVAETSGLEMPEHHFKGA